MITLLWIVGHHLSAIGVHGRRRLRRLHELSQTLVTRQSMAQFLEINERRYVWIAAQPNRYDFNNLNKTLSRNHLFCRSASSCLGDTMPLDAKHALFSECLKLYSRYLLSMCGWLCAADRLVRRTTPSGFDTRTAHRHLGAMQWYRSDRGYEFEIEYSIFSVTTYSRRVP